MPDPTLHGNGEACPACALRRETLRRQLVLAGHPAHVAIPCNNCGGKGRIAYSAATIVAEAAAEACRSYWPAFDRRNNAHG